ncbi:MAG: polysaccharide biosynthesis/export family protein [Acidobacteriota bacterium]
MALKLIARRSGLAAFVVATLAHAVIAAQGGPKVAPRDSLTISVFGVEALSGKFAVGPDGTISYPHLGQIKVAGLDARAVETQISGQLRQAGYLVNPQVTVELTQTPNKKVIITGAVRSPGQLPFAGEMTLFEALALVGSTTPEAGDLVLVVRAGAHAGDGETRVGDRSDDDGVIEVSLRALENGNLANNVTLEDGDNIVVPRAQQVFISGQVRSPGGYTVVSGTSVLQAITLAGGLTDRGTMRGLRIIRDKKEVKNVKADTVVRPGDTLVVKASPF